MKLSFLENGTVGRSSAKKVLKEASDQLVLKRGKDLKKLLANTRKSPEGVLFAYKTKFGSDDDPAAYDYITHVRPIGDGSVWWGFNPSSPRADGDYGLALGFGSPRNPSLLLSPKWDFVKGLHDNALKLTSAIKVEPPKHLFHGTCKGSELVKNGGVLRAGQRSWVTTSEASAIKAAYDATGCRKQDLVVYMVPSSAFESLHPEPPYAWERAIEVLESVPELQHLGRKMAGLGRFQLGYHRDALHGIVVSDVKMDRVK